MKRVFVVGAIHAIDLDYDTGGDGMFRARYFVITGINQYTCHGRISADLDTWFGFVSVPNDQIGDVLGTHYEYDGHNRKQRVNLEFWQHYKDEIVELIDNIETDFGKSAITSNLGIALDLVKEAIQAERQNIVDRKTNIVIFDEGKS